MIWIVFLKIMNLKHHHSSMKNNEKKLILDLYKYYNINYISATEISEDEINLLHNKYGDIRNILRNLIQEFEPNSEITEEYLDEKLKIYNISEVDEYYEEDNNEIEIKKSEVKKIKKSKIIIYISLILLLLFTYFSIIAPINRNYNDATNVKNFAEDKENVFVNTFYGLFKINKGNNEISQVKKINDYIGEIVVDENDEKWLITYDDTLYSFKNEQKITKHHPPFKTDKNQIWNDLENIKIDQFGTKWILATMGYRKYEVYSYDSFGNWEKYPFPEIGSTVEDMFTNKYYDDIIFPIQKLQVKANVVTVIGKLLFLENNGIMNPRYWSQLDYPTSDFNFDKSFVDKEHNVWISGSSNEKHTLYRLQDTDFIKYAVSKEIKALDSDTNGKVWIATEDGIEILNEKNSLIPKKEISKMFIDSNNKKWIGDIECYDGKEWKSYDFEIFKYVVKDFFNNLF